jgi:hypothetical protein
MRRIKHTGPCHIKEKEATKSPHPLEGVFGSIGGIFSGAVQAAPWCGDQAGQVISSAGAELFGMTSDGAVVISDATINTIVGIQKGLGWISSDDAPKRQARKPIC